MIQAPKGTRDVYGEEMVLWHQVEAIIRSITHAYHFSEIRNPVIESTDLFLRGVGDTTDIVQKEMYTFDDKGGRSITLRPELTAGVARAYIERGLHNQPQPTKLWYVGPIFRYERPQAGRYRQHYQFGLEVFGSSSYAAEAEIISMGWELLTRLGLHEDVVVHINSIGCPTCRKAYHTKLHAHIAKWEQDLCDLCRNRAGKNPLRVLDCKNQGCKDLVAQAPMVIDSLDEECLAHFNGVQHMLTAFGIPFVVDPKVVRGLDYYTRTVFEFISKQGLTVIGGGRYDGLISQLGGNPTPAVGFGMGMERLVLLLQQRQTQALENAPALFIGHAEAEGFVKAQTLAYPLRQAGLKVETDIVGRSVKAQMKYADKIKARYTCIIGGTELETNQATFKEMATGQQTTLTLDYHSLKELIS